MVRTRTYTALLNLAFATLGLYSVTAAQQPAAYTDSPQYSYLGCYRETTDIPRTNGARALNDGESRVGPGYMTVPMCLDFCGGAAGEVYSFAGLEYSRECWCAHHLNGLSVRADDSACDLQCDGNTTQLCGGRMMLSLYLLASSPIMTENKMKGGSLTMGSDSTVKGSPRMGSSSARTVVTSWMMLWGAAAMMINRV